MTTPPKNNNMLKISDLNFKIKSAILDAYIDKDDMKIKWGLDIQANPGNEEYSRWKPKASSEVFTESTPEQLNHWLDLAGTQVSWNKPYDPEDEPYATLYVFEHEPIFNSNIAISRNGNSLNVKWLGMSDVNWNSEYGQALPIEIETELLFQGIWFGKESEANSRSLLSKFLNPDLFEFVQTEHGVSLLRPK